MDTPQLLPGTLFLLILRTLSRGLLGGYAIARRIKDASAHGLEIEDGSLYPALNRMLVKGWVSAEWGISENNRRARSWRFAMNELRATLHGSVGGRSLTVCRQTADVPLPELGCYNPSACLQFNGGISENGVWGRQAIKRAMATLGTSSHV